MGSRVRIVDLDDGPAEERDGGVVLESASSPAYVTDNEGEHMAIKGNEESIWRSRVYRKGYSACCMTLCLSIMGGAVFPVPWAFSMTGAVEGALICIIVAAANVFTSELLIRQCYKTGTRDYEELAQAVGGPAWLLVTRVSLLVLLLGSLISPLRQSAEAAVFAVSAVVERVPDWMLYQGGAGFVFMAGFCALIVFPLCMIRELKSLEYAGVAGFLLIMFLVSDIVAQSTWAGFPALRQGDFPVLGFQGLGNSAQAISVLGYAFYLQPFMLPLLNEMPGTPRAQCRILAWAVRFAVLVFAAGVYLLVGFFGASWLGRATRGNILQNTLLGGGAGQALVNFLMAVYISLSMPATEFCTRRIILKWVKGEAGASEGARHLSVTTLILCSVLAAAMFWRVGSAKVLAVTGSTGVLMTSYVCPVLNHFLLYFGWAKCHGEARSKHEEMLEDPGRSSESNETIINNLVRPAQAKGATNPLERPLIEPLPPLSSTRIPGVLSYKNNERSGNLVLRAWDVFTNIVVPLVIMILGVLCSGVTMYITFAT